MKLCDVTAELLPEIAEIHRVSGFDYQFPKDFNTALFPVRRAVTHDSGECIAVAALKVETEAFLWMDHDSGTPEQRMAALELLSADIENRARTIGWDQVHCTLPPEVAERFGKRLEGMGWRLARPWPVYVFQLR